MTGPIEIFLADDHARLDTLLQRAAAGDGIIDLEPYGEFRSGLLRHIAMEEKVLMREARASGDPDLAVLCARLHADHSALAALLVPTPSRDIVATIVDIIDHHNPLEEGEAGLYARCEQLPGLSVDQLLTRMQAIAPVRASAYFDEPRVHEQIARLVAARCTDQR